MQAKRKTKRGVGNFYNIILNFFNGPGVISKTIVLAMVVSLCLVACETSKISQENFDKIKTGMNMAEVKAILGEPTESSGFGVTFFSGTNARWKWKDITIKIQFVNDKVIGKEFLQGKEAPKPGK